MDSELQAKVDQIKTLVDARETAEFDELYDAWTQFVLSNPLANPGEPQRSDIASRVDVDALFLPLVNMPSPGDFTSMIDLVFQARRDVTMAWSEMLTQLAANSVNWTGDAGDAFNRHVSRLTYASWEHTVLLADLESIYTTYQNLVVETRLAAHDLADKSIEVLEQMGRQEPLDWTAIATLAISIALIIAAELSPPTGAAALWITRAANIGTFATAGVAVLSSGATIGGSVRIQQVMETVAEAGAKLAEGVQAKAQVLADMLLTVPGLIEANRALVIPPAPVLPA